MSCEYQRICDAAHTKAERYNQWESLNTISNPTETDKASLEIAKENLDRAQSIVDLYDSPPAAPNRCARCILNMADLG